MHWLQEESKGKQWAKFREVTGKSEDALQIIKQAADPLRHGEIVPVTESDRAKIFEATWDVVDAYLQNT